MKPTHSRCLQKDCRVLSDSDRRCFVFFGTINYLANGSNKFPKERIEIFSEGKILQLDNFKKLKGYGWKSFRKMNLWHQDKGQKNCIKSFISSLENGTPAIPYDELFEVANVTIEIAQNLKK